MARPRRCPSDCCPGSSRRTASGTRRCATSTRRAPRGGDPGGRGPPTGGRSATDLGGYAPCRRTARLASHPEPGRHRPLGVALAHESSRRLRGRRRTARCDRMSATPSDGLRVAYVMSRFPKLTETFILAELEAMDRAGVAIELYPLLRQTGEPVQPAAVRWVERAHYLPFLSPGILRTQWWFLRDRRRRRRY